MKDSNAQPTTTDSTRGNPCFEGISAKEKGLSVEACPYNRDPQRKAWIAGWFIAERQPESVHAKF